MEIAVVSAAADLHALAVRHELQRARVRCHLIEADRACDTRRLVWRPEGGSQLPTDSGGSIEAAALDAIWWRRFNHPLQLPSGLSDPAHADLVRNDVRAALWGALLTSFHGAWISHPEATRQAESKLVQLAAAQREGVRVPRTLVSDDPKAIREFCAEVGSAVVKAVAGTKRRPLLTVRVRDELLAEAAALSLAPAIWQEEVPGRTHLRALVLGDSVHTATIESEALDWRLDLTVPVAAYQLEPSTEDAVRRVMRRLDLRMGVVDLKVTPEGEAVWLEVNPQGQFLFIEGLCGLPLTRAVARFLHDEAAAPSDGRSGAPSIRVSAIAR